MTNNAICAYVAIAMILDFTVNNHVHPFLITNCSIITYFITVNLETLPSFKALLHRTYVCA